MAEFVTELVGKFRPVPLADIDNDPRDAAAVEMEPNGRWPGCVLIHPQPRRLVQAMPPPERSDRTSTRRRGLSTAPDGGSRSYRSGRAGAAG